MQLNRLARSLWLGGLCAVLASCRLHASTIPLGGTHDEEEPLAAKAIPSAQAPGLASAEPKAEEPAADDAEEVEVTSAAPAEPAHEGTKASSSAFQFKPYVAHQAWTRVLDLEFALKIGPGGNLDMKMVSHQEARFEVLSVNAGAIDKLQIDYAVYTSTMSLMGTSQDAPEELAGKRFVVTFAQGRPDVRDATGRQPPKKQADSVKDDAREPLEIEKALKELTNLAAKGQGDFSRAGAMALAGGEDEDTKVTSARAKLQRVSSGPNNDKVALLDLGYTVTNAIDEKASIEVQVAGSLSVLDAPSRYQTSTLQGPMEIRSADGSGMQGRGTVKVTTSYKY